MKFFKASMISLVLSFLAILIPWTALKGSDFWDRQVYLNYVYYLPNILEYRDFNSIASYISQEWLWHYILLTIGEYISYEIFFSCISFFSLALMIFYLIRKHGVLSSLLLLNPLAVDLVMSQYRISFALIIVFSSIYLRKIDSKPYKFLSYFLVALASLIHSSVILFIFIYFSIVIISKINFKQKLFNVFSLVLLGIIISWSLSDSIYIVLDYFGDRRADYEVERVSSSLSYLSFWVVNLLILILSFSKKKYNTLQDKLTILILSIVSANSIFGGYSLRILSIFLPVIMSTNLEINLKLRIPLFVLYFLYSLIQWYFWLTQ